MRLDRLVMALMLVFVLAACGGNAADPGNTSDVDSNAPAAEADPEVVVSYTGAREGETAVNNLSLFCGNEGMPNTVNELEFYVINMPVLVGMNIPADLQPGTYEIIGSDDNTDFSGATPQADFEWRDMENSDLVNYDSGTGELTITEMPTAEGELFVATLTMELTSEEGETVNVTVEFDGDAGTQSFDEC